MLNARLGQHSANPCLIAASETGFEGVKSQVREPNGQICSGSLVQSTAGVAKPTRVLMIDSKQTVSYDRVIASRNR